MSVVFPPLYAIIDPALLKATELSFAEAMAEAGVQLLQYRDKRASTRHLFEMSNLLSHRLSSFAHVRFIVNDRPDIALLVGRRCARRPGRPRRRTSAHDCRP